MKIEIPLVLRDSSSQPVANPIFAASNKAVDIVITQLTTTPRFLKRSSTVASATNFTYYLPGIVGAQQVIENYKGDITCFPVPGAGEINVAIGLPDLANQNSA